MGPWQAWGKTASFSSRELNKKTRDNPRLVWNCSSLPLSARSWQLFLMFANFPRHNQLHKRASSCVWDHKFKAVGWCLCLHLATSRHCIDTDSVCEAPIRVRSALKQTEGRHWLQLFTIRSAESRRKLKSIPRIPWKKGRSPAAFHTVVLTWFPYFRNVIFCKM